MMVASAAINSMSSVATSSSNNFIAPFTLEKASSTEFRSEDYGGKKCTRAPTSGWIVYNDNTL